MSIYQKASLVQIPSGYKAADDKLYSVVPSNGDGDFTIDSSPLATRVNKDGLIESVAADQARLNYDPTNPQDPHLLLEPSRTNSLPESENFSTNWIAIGLTVSNGISSPDGGTNAYSIIEGTGTGGKIIYDTISVSAGSVTYSLFMKKGDKRYTALLLSGVVTTSMFNVDLENGTGTTATGSFDSTNIEEYPNGWYRVSVTATATAGNLNCNVYLMNGASYNDRNYTGNGTDKTYIFGAQLEAGTYPTSYIPTSGLAVTRTIDTCKLENFANMPTDYPFTVFWEGKIDDINFTQFAFSILDISSNVKYLGFSFSTTGYFQIHRRNINYDIDSQTFSMSAGDVLKIAIAFTSNTTYKCYINGSLIRNETSGLDVDFDFNDILIGQQRVISDGATRNQASQFMLFNEALSDSELQTLTS
jgi:hypothetical protein